MAVDDRNQPMELIENGALLVVDVQRGLFEKEIPIYRSENLLDNILDLVDRAHHAHAPVVYIQHSGNQTLIKGTRAWRLHEWLHPEPGDLSVFKEEGNAFKGTQLGVLLAERGIVSVVVVGLVTHGCVKSTCIGGLKGGYQVFLAGDGHSNFSKDAPKLITKWNNLLADKGVVVMNTTDIYF